MKALYLECPTGISGDMFLGALIHLGVDVIDIQQELSKLALDNYTIEAKKISKSSIQGIKFNVSFTDNHPHRHLKDIDNLITSSTLKDSIKDLALAIFRLLAIAEAEIHGTLPEKVHFHEVGAVDSIVDIVGAAIALDILGVKSIYSSPIPLGNGFVQCQHGLLPVPGPATLEIVKRASIPIISTELQGELVTPTGAALLAGLVKDYGPSPLNYITNIGYGAGSKDLPIPNLLRVTLGDVIQTSNDHNISSNDITSSLEKDEVIIIDTNIDDMNPEFYPYITKKAFVLGALDVYLTPIIMKKGRPGNILSIMVEPDNLPKITELLLKETSSLGIRYRSEERYKSYKQILDVRVFDQDIRVKYTTTKDNVILNIAPEYEDCKIAAINSRLPLKIIYEQARMQAYSILKEDCN